MLRHIPFYASLLGRELTDKKNGKNILATASHVLVYGAIEAHSMGSKGCIASNELIGKETGLKATSVKTIISQLSRSGWIEVELNKARNNRISINPLLMLITPTVNPDYRERKSGLTIEYSRGDSIEGSSSLTLATSKPKSEKPNQPSEVHQLVEAVSTLQGMPMPLNKGAEYKASKAILATYPLEVARATAERMSKDPYWSKNRFSVTQLRNHFNKFHTEPKPEPEADADTEEAWRRLHEPLTPIQKLRMEAHDYR